MAVVFLLVWGGQSGAQTAPSGDLARIVVPISRQVLPDGATRFSVPVRIGDGPVMKAMLDTGSFGLRVLARMLDPTQYQVTETRRAYRFDSGVALRGPLARAPIAIGDAATAAPILFQLVRAVVCDARHPRCPAARVAPAAYGIGGDGIPGAGYAAILGISTQVAPSEMAAVDPLPLTGAARWIIILPVPGATAPGELILNPSVAELSGFRPTSQISGRAIIPNCPESPVARQAICPPMRLDSGDERGIAPFYTYAVLVDEAAGVIGVKRRPG